MLKKKSKILIALFLILVLVSSFSFATVEPRTTEDNSEVTAISSDENTTTTSENEESSNEQSNWINSDLFSTTDDVNISQVVDGNAFVSGNNVTISGEIGGDLFVVANKLTIEGGYVYSSIFACANEITVNGVVYDLYAVCNSINIGSNGYIYRDMKVNANTISIEGKVRRNAFLNAKNINLSADNGTLIYGNLNYSAPSEITIPDNCVTGEVNYSQMSSIKTNTTGINVFSYILNLIRTLIFTLVISLLILWLTPKFKERICSMSVGKSFASLGIGIATPIVAVLVSILLIFTIICIPLSIAILFLLASLYIISFSVSSLFFGGLFTKLLKMEGNVKLVLFTLVSALIMWLLTLIPFVGVFISFLIATFGLGTTVVNIVYKKEAVKKEEIK